MVAVKLFIRTQPLQKKMHGREEERIGKTYEELLEYLQLPGDGIQTHCFDVGEIIEVDRYPFLKGYKLCIKHGKSLRKFITLYLKQKDKIHDRLTLFFDESGKHVDTEYIHSLGTVHRLEKKEKIREYECGIEVLFTQVLGEKVELIID